ncbi:MAG: hypothetical protein SF051_12550 [Elusimicrobiota bacterium]|nr:hypothetical protein [Elusimicrobiota bacterium]
MRTRLKKSLKGGRFVLHGAALLGFAAAGISFGWLLLLSPFYLTAMRTGLPGMRGGPQDAFRHTLASAFVARFVSPRAVDAVTDATESGRTRNSRMDRHNNRIGRDIGARGGSAAEVYRRVREQVAAGRVDSEDPAVTTWLPEKHWSVGL